MKATIDADGECRTKYETRQRQQIHAAAPSLSTVAHHAATDAQKQHADIHEDHKKAVLCGLLVERVDVATCHRLIELPHVLIPSAEHEADDGHKYNREHRDAAAAVST